MTTARIPSAIDLDPGETVTCTFVNTFVGEASIVIEKQTNPNGDPTEFPFASTFGAFSLSDGEQMDSGTLDEGTYSVAEGVPAGWAVTDIDCSGGASVLIGTDSDFDLGDTGVEIDLGMRRERRLRVHEYEVADARSSAVA